MASATEFLTKQLNIEKEIVTFRRLSRALSIHVNVAKNELASFHASSQATDEPVHATFLLTGDVASVKAYGSYRDENEVEVDDDESEMVSSTRILLVGEHELDAAKAQFTRVSSVHIYSLSPSPVRDAALLAPAADDVRLQYINKGKDYHQMVGIVVGADVKVKTFPSRKGKANVTASSSKLNPPPQEKKPADTSKSSDNKGKAVAKEMKKGTLDWSKAKSKSEKEEAPKTVKKEKEKEKAATKKESAEQGKAAPKKESNVTLKRQDSKVAIKMESEESEIDVKKKKDPEKPKKGKKRPSAVMSLSDSEEDEHDNNPAPKTKPRISPSPLPSKPASTSDKRVKVKKGALISDDEDDTLDAKSKPRQRGKGKGRAVLSDDNSEPDRSAREIMDLDDSHFIRHNKTSTKPEDREEDEEEDIDMVSDSEPTPPRAKPKKKPKKVVPVGKNGLPKKRIVKSRKSKDARGYMITQDYSSYESVSESEQAPAASESGKKPTKAMKNSKEGTSGKPAASKPRPKPRPSEKSTAGGEESSAERSKLTQTDADAKSDVKQVGSGSGGGTKSNGAKSTNGSKKNLMNYFGKK